jgi:hypothetical protein
MILLTSHDLLLLLFWSRTQNNAPRTQNKHDQLIDQLFPRWRACTTGVGKKRKTFSSTYVLPFNDWRRCTMAKFFCKFGRDSNCKSHYLTAQHMASSLPVLGECRTLFRPRHGMFLWARIKWCASGLSFILQLRRKWMAYIHQCMGETRQD